MKLGQPATEIAAGNPWIYARMLPVAQCNRSERPSARAQVWPRRRLPHSDSDEVKRIGEHPIVVRLRVGTATAETAATGDDNELLLGPYHDPLGAEAQYV
jgi:hypothetical protein